MGYPATRAMKHGMHMTPEYKSWGNMLQRCLNPRHRDYARYGGRGISVCEAWRDFQTFYRDMGQKPLGKVSLDRIDNSGNYEPANCRWADRTQQQRNLRTNRVLTLDGISMPLAAWASRIGISRDALWNRLDDGWTVERALTTPNIPRELRPCNRERPEMPDCLSIDETLVLLGISRSKFYREINKGSLTLLRKGQWAGIPKSAIDAYRR